MDQLTPREAEVLRLIASGRSTKQVASDLGISFKTAVAHRTHILAKFDAVNTADLVVRAIRAGVVDVFGDADYPVVDRVADVRIRQTQSLHAIHFEAAQRSKQLLASARSKTA